MLITYIGKWNNDEEAFVEDLTLVLTEGDEDDARISRGAKADGSDAYYIGYWAAGDTGFAPQFADGTNQVRHLWAYVNAGFKWGIALGHIAARIRESREPKDFALGVIGAAIGAGLDGIGLSLEELADFIRKTVCWRD